MKYLYYHLWQSLVKIKTNDTPALNSMLLISLAEFMNFNSIYILLSLKYDIDLKLGLLQKFIEANTKLDAIIFSALTMFSLFLFNYFYLIKSRNKSEKKYKDNTKKQRIIGIILAYFYVIVSIIVAFIIGPEYTERVINFK